jgi:hypothetical protein
MKHPCRTGFQPVGGLLVHVAHIPTGWKALGQAESLFYTTQTAGIPADRITIDREPLGVCIFLEGRRL